VTSVLAQGLLTSTGANAMNEAESTEPKKINWFAHHKVLTAIGGLFIFSAIIGSSSGKSNLTTPSADNKTIMATTAPTPTPTPAPVVKAPDPITLTGTGQKATQKFVLEEGLSVFKMTHKGSSNFAPTLLDSDGETVELLTNKIGAFDGSKAVQIPRAGQYLIDVTASGAWIVTITQPRQATAPTTKSFNGGGQLATELFYMPKGLAIFQMHHVGKSNWAPILMNAKGDTVELLANEIGAFDGSKAVKIDRAGLYIFDVTADGPWIITVQ
jgi:hypothetical protein